MTREETAERIKIMQAYVDGKRIQYAEDDTDVWHNIDEPDWYSDYEYRIKPESEYRPFKNVEECWQEMQKHQPFGWVKISYGYFNIIGIKENAANLGEIDNFMDYKYLYENYTFADGTPFGIKEED